MKDSELRKLLKDAVVIRPLPLELRARLQETLEEASMFVLLEDVPEARDIPPRLRRKLKRRLRTGRRFRAMTRTTHAFAAAAALVAFATVGAGVVANMGTGASHVIGTGPLMKKPTARASQKPGAHYFAQSTQKPKPGPTASAAGTPTLDPGQAFVGAPPDTLALNGPMGSCGVLSTSQPHDAGWAKITVKQTASASETPSPAAAEASVSPDEAAGTVRIEFHLKKAPPKTKYMPRLVELGSEGCSGTQDDHWIIVASDGTFDYVFEQTWGKGAFKFQLILTPEPGDERSDSAFVSEPKDLTVE